MPPKQSRRFYAQRQVRIANLQNAVRQLQRAAQQAVRNHWTIRRRFYNIAGSSNIVLAAFRSMWQARNALAAARQLLASELRAASK